MEGIERSQGYWAWTLLVLPIIMATRLVRERSGRAGQMIRDHELASHTLGIRVTRYKILAFVITSTVIGFQGALIGHFSGSVSAGAYVPARAQLRRDGHHRGPDSVTAPS